MRNPWPWLLFGILVAFALLILGNARADECLTQEQARARWPNAHLYWHSNKHCWDNQAGRHPTIQRHVPTLIEDDLSQQTVDLQNLKWQTLAFDTPASFVMLPPQPADQEPVIKPDIHLSEVIYYGETEFNELDAALLRQETEHRALLIRDLVFALVFGVMTMAAVMVSRGLSWR